MGTTLLCPAVYLHIYYGASMQSTVICTSLVKQENYKIFPQQIYQLYSRQAKRISWLKFSTLRRPI